MTLRRLAVLPLLLPLLAACGGADRTPVARDPAPTTAPATVVAEGAPHWPTEGCDTRSGSSIDYVPEAEGTDTVEEALAPYVPDGATVVKKPAREHRNAQWLVVNQDNEIVAAIEAFQGGNGWLIGGTEQCSG